jgi:hypothetical protein
MLPLAPKPEVCSAVFSYHHFATNKSFRKYRIVSYIYSVQQKRSIVIFSLIYTADKHMYKMQNSAETKGRINTHMDMAFVQSNSVHLGRSFRDIQFDL